MCFEFCLVTHVLGRMEVGWTDWGRAPGEETSTGDGTCLKVPSKYEPVVPGTRSPREEGLHLPAVVLRGVVWEFGQFFPLDLGWAGYDGQPSRKHPAL